MILYDNANPNGLACGPYRTASKRDKAAMGKIAKQRRAEHKKNAKLRSNRVAARFSSQLSPSVR